MAELPGSRIARQLRFERRQPAVYPVLQPSGYLVRCGAEFCAQVIRRSQILQRLDIRYDQLCQCTNVGTAEGIGRQQGRLRVGLFQPFENGPGLRQHLPIHFQRGHAALRVQAQIVCRELLLATGGNVYRAIVRRQALQAESDADAIGGAAAPKAMENHALSLPERLGRRSNPRLSPNFKQALETRLPGH